MKVAARSSPLSIAQIHEIETLLKTPLTPILVKTHGDIDQKTSLRTLSKTDFFTREVDELVLSGQADFAIHSAKDLPETLPEGLTIAHITPSIDPRDALVLRPDKNLPSGALIGSSSPRRDEALKAYRSDLVPTDIRGTIEQRIKQLDRLHGVIIAEAALIRLNLTHLPRIYLSGDTTPLQGCLALVTRKGEYIF